MRRLLQLLARLYPAEWRARYGAEYAALLEEREPRWRDVVDVAWAAVKLWVVSWRFVRVVLPCAMAGGLVALVFAFVRPPEYASQALFTESAAIHGICEEPQNLPPGLRGGKVVFCTNGQTLEKYLRTARGDGLSREFLASEIQKDDLYPRERARKPMAAVVDEMRRHIRVSAGKEGSRQEFVVEFDYPDPVAAQKVDDELASEVVIRVQNEFTSRINTFNPSYSQERIAFLKKRLRLANNVAEARILREAIRQMRTGQFPPPQIQPLTLESFRAKVASLPQGPDGLSRAQMGLVGLLGGLLCGLSLAAVMRPGRGVSIGKS